MKEQQAIFARLLLRQIKKRPKIEPKLIMICAAMRFQFCAVLLELEEARGSHVTKSEGGTSDLSTTPGVVDKPQLSLHSVEALHKENLRLTQRLGELMEEKSREQSQETSAR